VPLYQYKALNQTGRRVTGQMTANNDVDLFQRLRQVNLELISAKAHKGGGGLSALLSRGISNRELVQLCMHLQQLTGAGVGLMEGLADVRDSTDHRRLRDLIAETYENVASGASLSEAFAKHPRIFGTVFTSLLAAGEESGNLTESFFQLVKHLKWTDDINRKVKKAVRSPMFMLVVLAGMFGAMMTFVVPQLIGFLTGQGQKIPAITAALIATSDAVRVYWWAFIGIPVGLVMGVGLLRRTSEQFALRTDLYLLRLPVLGDMIRKIALSRFAHFFATMFQSGVPILNCLETASRVVGNRGLVRSLETVRAGVADGNPLSTCLRNTGEFPSLVIRMVRIGEESGNLGETLNNVTDFYDRDVDEAVNALIDMISPAMTVVGGGMMVWIIAAVMGPLYNNLGNMAG
jgi:type IV pilus assembly protein PilC